MSDPKEARESAIKEILKIEGVDYKSEAEILSVLINTIGAERKVLGMVWASTQAQVIEIVKIANAFKLPLYTSSTGRNWGYGSQLPAQNECLILNLSRMNKIIHLDPLLGTVTVEPGVTQADLHQYLQERNLPFMVPTTGAGPSGSLLGNALEKGFGITPHEDHFAAVLGLKAILPDGSLYQSALTEMGGHRVDKLFKWKLGPYLDGLFCQSNLGVVTQVSIALPRRPENVVQFIVYIEDENFEEAVGKIRRIKQKLGSILGGVNIMSKRRLLAMVENDDVWRADAVMSEMQLRELAQKRNLPDWAVLGGIYVPSELSAGVEEMIRQEFRPFAEKIIFLNRKKVGVLKKVLGLFPIKSLERTVKSIEQALNILEGIPSRVALPLAYLKNKKRPDINDPSTNPDLDRCGLIWFSPLLPIEPTLVRDFTQEVTRVCVSYDIDPLITLTAISERCFDSTIPLVFDATSDSQRDKARQCYNALIEVAREFGIFPYRLDIEGLREYYDNTDNPALKMTRAIKQAIDPNQILSPGRYS